MSIPLELIAEEIRVCPDCELSRTRTHAVPGSGSATASVMFIGEAPGWHEDQQGLPFIGAAGKFLDELLGKAGLDRSTVFITNVVKCRPPGNRDPLPDEIMACSSYLDRQIAEIDPAVVVTLGRFSMARWFPGDRISKIHGVPKEADGRLIVPMYHPAAALHQGSLRAVIEEDFVKLGSIIRKAQVARAVDGRPLPEQETPMEQGRLF